jgi:hypothetical protein
VVIDVPLYDTGGRHSLVAGLARLTTETSNVGPVCRTVGPDAHEGALFGAVGVAFAAFGGGALAFGDDSRNSTVGVGALIIGTQLIGLAVYTFVAPRRPKCAPP